MLNATFQDHRPSVSEKKKRFFIMYGHDSHLGHVT